MTRILVISDGPVGSRMAAPGIRAFNIARVLQAQVPDAEVTLALPPGLVTDFDGAAFTFKIVSATTRDLGKLALHTDVVVAGRLMLALLPASLGARIVFDMYSPRVTEWANVSRWFGKRHRRAWLDAKRKHLMMELTAADFVLCANERQRDYVAGMMGTHGMITRSQFDRDSTLGQRIAVAPLGIRPREPPTRPERRGLHPAIKDEDVVLLWNGTIVEWYDVPTLLHAVDQLRQERDDIKLIFLGTQYPQADGKEASGALGYGAVDGAIEMSRELGLLDTHVFFNHGWADDATTERHLVEADIGVSTYFDNLETHYSFRVRYLDLFWASLPIVCTRGDTVSQMVDARNLGRTVQATDVEGLADAIRALADLSAREECRRNLQALRQQFAWERTLAPLIDFCSSSEVVVEAEKRARILPLLSRSADWMLSEAHEKLRFAYRKKLLRSGHTGLG